MSQLCAWLAWHWRQGGVGLVSQGSLLQAVGVARCVRSVAEARADAYAHHEDPDTGVILWVDQLASLHRLGLPLLLAQARDRFGPRPTICGDVFQRPGQLRLIKWQRVEKILHHHGLS